MDHLGDAPEPRLHEYKLCCEVGDVELKSLELEQAFAGLAASIHVLDCILEGRASNAERMGREAGEQVKADGGGLIAF